MSPEELYDRMEMFYVDSVIGGIDPEKVVGVWQNIEDLMKQCFALSEQSQDKQIQFEQYAPTRQFQELVSVCPQIKNYVNVSDFITFFRRVNEIENDTPRDDLFNLALVYASKISVVLQAIMENELPPN